LLPFAPLSGMADADRPAMLARVLREVASVADPVQREVLQRVTIDLAAIRLDRDTIRSTWEDSDMPIPSLLNTLYQEGRAAGREEGREEGRRQAAAALLRHRFGPDARIPVIARRLARLAPEGYLDQIDAAKELDDLVGD
jgi:hypothetical protein